MSHRPIQEKKLRKLERALRKAATPAASIDLIDWLKTRGHAQTTGAAVRLLLAGKVRVDSHIVGRQEIPVRGGKTIWGVAPMVAAHHRDSITVDD
jgi:ribosome-associated protein YbcJ (S4-like RNA binding protein)